MAQLGWMGDEVGVRDVEEGRLILLLQVPTVGAVVIARYLRPEVESRCDYALGFSPSKGVVLPTISSMISPSPSMLICSMRDRNLSR